MPFCTCCGVAAPYVTALIDEAWAAVMSEQTSIVPPPDAGVGATAAELAAVLEVGTAEALEPTDWWPAEVAAVAAAAVAVAVCGVGAVVAAVDFDAGLHAAEDNATTTTATAADSARTCIAAPCFGSVP